MFWITSFFGIAICYAINIFCGVKVVKFVGAHAGFNPRMKELNQQLTKTLIILVFIINGIGGTPDWLFLSLSKPISSLAIK
jgi:hypothetical protein